MYKYRVYLEKGFGYELDSFVYSEEELYKILDYYILELEYENKILVIKYDKELNQDSVFYMYAGGYKPFINEYLRMRVNQDKEKRKIR